MPFEMKSWLDEHVVPVTKNDPPLTIYSFIWNGDPPKEILVWLLAGSPAPEPTPPDDPSVDGELNRMGTGVPGARVDDFDPTAWARAVKHLLDGEFRFDFTREQQMVQTETGLIPVFGGDGAPIFDKSGMASARVFRKCGPVGLILQIGCKFPPAAEPAELGAGQRAAAAVKEFYGLFEENPLDVIRAHGAVFGQA